MRFTPATASALFGLALSLSTAQASPFPASSSTNIVSTPVLSTTCTNFNAACATQCGTQKVTSKCIDATAPGRLPTLKCQCGKGLLSDKTAEVLFRMALSCASAAPAPAPAPVPVPAGPAFKNAGFQDATIAPWMQFSEFSACGPISTMDRNLVLTKAAACEAANANVGLQQEVSGLTKDTTYSVTFYAKQEAGSDGFSPFYGVLSDTDAQTQGYLSSAAAGWKLMTHEFTAKAETETFYVKFYANSASGRVMLLDDFAIAVKPATATVK